MLTAIALLGTSSTRSHAAQHLRIENNLYDECGIAVPVSTLRQYLRELLQAQSPDPVSDCFDVWTEFDEGGDDSTSEEDTLKLHGLVWHVGPLGIPCAILGADVTASIRFIPGETARHPDLNPMLTKYRCVDQSDPGSFPTFFVSRIRYYRIGHNVFCAGDDCPRTGEYERQKAEDYRCDIQEILQQGAAYISDPLEPLYLFGMDGLLLPTGEDPTQKYRTTITETGGEPHNIMWRFVTEGNAEILRRYLLQNQEIADEYGVFMVCEHGQSCGSDRDHDGWCDADDVCPDHYNCP